jgi:23S rRNA (cytidine1920-2'-O)/16S rRNA (cytidine1409-2'-O)-methyltransferase
LSQQVSSETDLEPARQGAATLKGRKGTISPPGSGQGKRLCSAAAPTKARLDELLVEKDLAPSREKAKALIMAGLVEVEGARIDKPGRVFPVSAAVTVKNQAVSYVSRGGLKLEAVLDAFSVDVTDKVFLDAGASTGGFTDCLLRRGARRVIAVDVGYGQFDWRLRNDPRVTLLEKTNVRYLKPEDLGESPDGAAIDVSFISLQLIVPPVSALLKPRAMILALIKPQFEVGKGKVGKGGVVRDPALHRQVIDDVIACFERNGWTLHGHIPSPVLGPKGNQEFLVYLTRGAQG